MHASSIFTGGLFAAFLLVGPAAAQAPAPGLAPTAWRSAFESYQPYADAPVASWRESNETVGRIGGWRAYAREAQDSAPPEGVPSQSAGPATPAAPTPARSGTPATGHRH